MIISTKTEIPLYGGLLHFIYSKSSNVKNLQEFIKLPEDYKIIGVDNSNAITIQHPITYDIYIVILDPKVSIGTLAHESLHAVNFIMSYVCHGASRDNDEPDAYLLAWIFDNLNKFYIEKINNEKFNNTK